MVHPLVPIIRRVRIQAEIVENLVQVRLRQCRGIVDRIERLLAGTIPIVDLQAKADRFSILVFDRAFTKPYPGSIACFARTDRRYHEIAQRNGRNRGAGPDDTRDVDAASSIVEETFDRVRHVLAFTEHVTETPQIFVVAGHKRRPVVSALGFAEERGGAGRNALDRFRAALDLFDVDAGSKIFRHRSVLLVASDFRLDGQKRSLDVGVEFLRHPFQLGFQGR